GWSTEQVEKLFSGVENTIIGTVYGGLVVAAVQGALVGLALWILGIPSPVLWGVVTSFFALLPLVGTAAVWLPAALYLLVTGSWIKAIVLAVLGKFVVWVFGNMPWPFLISGAGPNENPPLFFS